MKNYVHAKLDFSRANRNFVALPLKGWRVFIFPAYIANPLKQAAAQNHSQICMRPMQRSFQPPACPFLQVSVRKRSLNLRASFLRREDDAKISIKLIQVNSLQNSKCHQNTHSKHFNSTHIRTAQLSSFTLKKRPKGLPTLANFGPNSHPIRFQ